MDRLRPNKFSDIVGQHKVKNALAISINSAKLRNDSLGHILIDANAGQGKTTISLAIANELGVGVKTILGSNIKTFRDIIPTLNNIKQNEVLFIDEVYSLGNKEKRDNFSKECIGIIYESIDKNSYKSLAPITTYLKGNDKPLIGDTGLLISSVISFMYSTASLISKASFFNWLVIALPDGFTPKNFNMALIASRIALMILPPIAPA